MSQTCGNTKGFGEQQTPAVLSQYCVQEGSSPLQQLHLTLQERTGNGGAQKVQKEAKFWEQAKFVLCLHTDSDISQEGGPAGSQPRVQHRGQPAPASLCPGLPKDRCAPSCGWLVPRYAAVVPIRAAARAEGERGLAWSPGCLPWGCLAVGAEPRDAARLPPWVTSW